MYHEQYVSGWTGPTGFYKSDMRAPMAPDESKTWDSIYLWGDPHYAAPQMSLALQPSGFAHPPPERTYTLTLLAVPKDVTGAPAIGTTWMLPLNEQFTVTLPTYTTTNGLTGYQFAFSASAVTPEPAALALGLLLAAVGRRR